MKTKLFKKYIEKRFQTPLGDMIAICDDSVLYLLQFADNPSCSQKIKRLLDAMQATIVPGTNTISTLIAHELNLYFSGRLTTFTTPIVYQGTPFSVEVWQKLCQIPYRETRAYADIAAIMGRPTAYRAVARANASNPLAIVVPCHRVIARDNSLSGYNGGVERKALLLQHEQKALP